jgi:hypothetical protein
MPARHARVADGPSGKLVEPWNEARDAGAVGFIFGSEMRAQQTLFRFDARDERRDEKGREQHADEGSESQRPAERADNHAQITRVADHAIHAAGHEHVPALDGDKPAETAAKDEHRPEATDRTDFWTLDGDILRWPKAPRICHWAGTKLSGAVLIRAQLVELWSRRFSACLLG